MKELSKKELSQIVGGSLADWCAAVKTIYSNHENAKNMSPETYANGIKLYNAKTLSKILCKWKQDSVISFFLYLDSAFKYKHKLVHNQSPV